MALDSTPGNWPYGLTGARRDILALASCIQVNMLGRRHGIGGEPEVSIPEIIRRLPEEVARRVARRVRRYSRINEDPELEQELDGLEA